MKKTIYRIMVENPELTPEEAGQRFVEQPESEAAAPEAGVASNSAERVRLDTTQDDYAPKMGLGIQATNSQSNPPHLGIQYPITAQQTANLKKYADSALPTPEAAPVATGGGMSITSEKPVTETYIEDVAPTPIPPEKPNINQELVGYREQKGADGEAVRGLFGERADKEDAITTQIEAEEDRVRQIKGDSGTEAGLYGAGKVFSGMLGSMLGFDASHAKEGFSEAQKAVAGRSDEARQRREFLQQRLFRADDKTKRAGEELQFGKAMRGERQANIIDEDVTQSEQTKARNNTARNKLDSVKLGEEGKLYDPQSTTSMTASRIAKSQLKRVADEGGSMAAVAQEAYDNYDSTDPLKPGLSQESVLSRNAMIEGILKANKDGTKWQFQKASIGGREVIGAFNEQTPEWRELDGGNKLPSGGGGGVNSEENQTIKLAKMLKDENVPEMDAALTQIDTIASRNGGKFGNIDGTGRIQRMLPESFANLSTSKEGLEFKQAVKSASNALINSRAGLAVTTKEEQRVLGELGQGNFSSPEQMETGINAIRRVRDIIVKNISGGFKDTTKRNYKTQGGISLDGKSTEAARKVVTDPNDL